MKRSIYFLILIIVLIGCSDKNKALNESLNNNEIKNDKNMASLKGKDLYMIFKTTEKDIEVIKFDTNIPSKSEIEKIKNFNKENSNEMYGCIKLEVNGKSNICADGQLSTNLNDPFTRRDINPYGMIFSPVLLTMDTLSGFKQNMTSNIVAKKQLEEKLIKTYSIVLNHKLNELYKKTILNYQNSTSVSDRKKYEGEYLKFINLEKILGITILDQQNKNEKDLNINEFSGLGNLLTNMQSNGSLKLKVKISLKANYISDIPIKYGNYSVEVKSDLILSYRISAWIMSVIKDQTITKRTNLILSPENQYSAIFDIDFGEYIQSSKGKFVLLDTDQQLVDAKLNIEFKE